MAHRAGREMTAIKFYAHNIACGVCKGC